MSYERNMKGLGARDGLCACGHVLDRSTDERCRHCERERLPRRVAELIGGATAGTAPAGRAVLNASTERTACLFGDGVLCGKCRFCRRVLAKVPR